MFWWQNRCKYCIQCFYTTICYDKPTQALSPWILRRFQILNQSQSITIFEWAKLDLPSSSEQILRAWIVTTSSGANTYCCARILFDRFYCNSCCSCLLPRSFTIVVLLRIRYCRNLRTTKWYLPPDYLLFSFLLVDEKFECTIIFRCLLSKYFSFCCVAQALITPLLWGSILWCTYVR